VYVCLLVVAYLGARGYVYYKKLVSNTLIGFFSDGILLLSDVVRAGLEIMG